MRDYISSSYKVISVNFDLVFSCAPPVRPAVNTHTHVYISEMFKLTQKRLFCLKVRK